MWIVKLALRRPYTVATLCAVIVIMAALSMQRMKVDMLPPIDIPVVVVVWNYQGMSTEEAEKRIAFPAERGYSSTVGGISGMESQSIPGLVIVRIFFEPGTDVGGAIAQVNSVSGTITRIMPPGIQPPIIIRFNASNVPVAQLTVSGNGVSEQQLFDYGSNFLRLRLFAVKGLSTPAPYGGRSRQLVIDVDPARAAARGLSPQEIVQVLLRSNVILPAGSVRADDTDYDIQMNSSPRTVADFGEIPVKVVGNQMVLLRDVASVHDGFATQTNIVRVNGNRATYLSLLKKADASTLAVVEAARDLLPKLQAAAPEGVELKLDFDQSGFARRSVMGMLEELAISSLLVALIILFFLGSWRSTVLVLVSLPLAMAVGVIGLYLTGHTLNMMTLGGLALAVGMLVDDATVEVENIHRNLVLGKRVTRAILDGAQQIAVPALAATLCICIVFAPVTLLEGPARFLFSPLALAVVFSMLASYMLSRTLVPSLARKLMEKEAVLGELPHGRHGAADPGPAARFNAWRDRNFARVQNAYVRVLETVLLHKGKVLLGALAVIVIPLTLLPIVGLDFFPSVDTGLMRLHFRAPPGTRIEQTERLVQDVESMIRDIVPSRELDTINDNIGVPVFFNLAFVQSDNTGPQDAEILISLKPEHRPTQQYMTEIRARVAPHFPGSSMYFQPADIVSQVLSFGVSAPVDIRIESRDSAKAFATARNVYAALIRIPGIEDARILQSPDKPTLRIDVDRQRAALFGLSQQDVAENMLTSLSSSIVVAPSFWVNPTNGVNYPVVVQTPPEQLTSLDAVMATPVSSPQSEASGQTAPYLGAIAQLRPTQGLTAIQHDSVQPVVNVQAAVSGRDLGGVSADIDRMIAGLKDLPKDVNIRVRGQGETMSSAFRSMGLGLLLAVVLVYLLLAVLFQSWLDPFIILMAVPGAFAGILWMLALTGTTLNVSSMMGAIMAIGLSVSNSILIVSFANEVRVTRGLDVLAAAREAGRTRLRPVIMTALAMVIGMVPMSLGLGAGGEQNAPLARAVIGGLLAATAMTLFVIPLLYATIRKRLPSAHLLDQQFERDAAPTPGVAES